MYAYPTQAKGKYDGYNTPESFISLYRKMYDDNPFNDINIYFEDIFRNCIFRGSCENIIDKNNVEKYLEEVEYKVDNYDIDKFKADIKNIKE
jgi:hypothetical protein